MTFILGLNTYHGDSSACLIKSGKIIAAAEEERFNRIKHFAGFPYEAIRYCLEEAKISIHDVDHIAVNTNPKANFFKKILYTIKNKPNLKFLLDRLKNKKAKSNIESDFKKRFKLKKINAKFHYIEHHMSHLASAHLASPFKNSVTISVDGFGDFSSGALGVGEGNKIKIDKKFFFPHSLGIFYQALTQFIGFPNYGDEYKVMGLAPYGNLTFMKEMHKILYINKKGEYSLNLNVFRHHNEKIAYEWHEGAPKVGQLFNSKLEKVFGIAARKKGEALSQKHFDIARSTQAMYEKAFFNLLNTAYKKYKINKLTLSGGCAMNSVANGKVFRNSPFKKLYIPAAAGDAGGAIGSAYIVATKLGFKKKNLETNHAYWGPSFENNYHKTLLNNNLKRINKANCKIEHVIKEDELCSLTAKSISQGKIVGWFQGRMEWGPRALGNRSILGDPRLSNMKDILNLKIKRRESFRPFAPSILREDVSKWFEEEDDVPFMMQVYQIKKDKQNLVPAITHVDGSGRLQTVHASTNLRFHKLISEFKKLTKVPIILNTSFNENEPVVCRPEEALETFLRTKMDILILGNWTVERKS